MTESNNESTEQTKKCSKCGEVKTLSMFYKDRSRLDGKYPSCKSCHKAYKEANKETISKQRKAYREANKELISKRMKTYYEANRETVLKRVKAYREANKETISKQRKAYREANKELLSKQRKKYREANRDAILERYRAYREANRTHLRKQYKRHYKNNKSKYLDRYVARRAQKKNNTPKFIRDCPVDKKRRVFTYNLSRLLTETTGIQHHVDHMWPINDGGPHWSGNLQVIPAVDNLSKNDKVDEEVKKTIQEGLEYARQCYERGEVC